MSRHDLSRWAHRHDYCSSGHHAAERGTRLVLWITLATMVVEIVAGWWFNSMAVLADGWHMSSHALAIGLSVLAYRAARKYADDPRFAFGTWKIEVLAGYTSALGLLGVAAAMIFGSVERLIAPQTIAYAEALGVADKIRQAIDRPFLLEGTDCVVSFHDGTPLSVELPASVVLTVTHTEPGLQGNRSNAGTKPATVETGAEIQVPLFIGEGEKVKVNTTDGSYLGREN